MILIAEDAALTQRLVFAFVAYLPGVDEQGNVFHDNINGFRHGFAQRPGNSSQGLGTF